MATTYGTDRTTRPNPAIYWIVGIGVLIALIAFFTMRNDPALTDTSPAITDTPVVSDTPTTTTAPGGETPGTNESTAGAGSVTTDTTTGTTETETETGTGVGTEAESTRMGREPGNEDAGAAETGTGTGATSDDYLSDDPNLGTGEPGPDTNPRSPGD
jgi:cytoskeletal protein RodZ